METKTQKEVKEKKRDRQTQTSKVIFMKKEKLSKCPRLISVFLVVIVF